MQIDENDVFSKKSLDNQDIPPEPDGVVTEEEFEHFQRRLMGDYLQYLIDRMSNDTQRAAAFIKRIHQAGILLPGETREAPDYYLPNPKLTEYKEETLKRHYNQSDDPDERQALAREWNHRNAIDYLYRNDHSPVNIYSNKITVWASKLYHDLPNMDGYEWGDQFQPPALAQLAANACRRDLIILVEDTDREGQDDQGNPTHVSGYYSAQYDGITGSLVVVSSSSIWEPSRQRVVQSEFSSDEEAKIKEALIRLVGVRVRRRALEARDLLIQQFTDLGIFDDEDLQ
ncbi:hypothetical protein FWH58_01635 [Candidatus Saccharibacteria bacterium]|nr:hypothetical protein [Candidatus Saccharibacteria bacterium]